LNTRVNFTLVIYKNLTTARKKISNNPIGGKGTKFTSNPFLARPLFRFFGKCEAFFSGDVFDVIDPPES
jgi:hypothetical protein